MEKVNKLSQNNVYVPEDVHFVELESHNAADVQALKNVAKYWKHSIYTDSVYNSLLDKSKSDKSICERKFYSLTTQQSGFELLDDEKILGISEVMVRRNPSEIYLCYIEADPKYIYEQTREYKRIGTAMLDSLKKLYSKITLNARDTYAVKKFYLKNDFLVSLGGPTHFVWYKNIFDNFMK